MKEDSGGLRGLQSCWIQGKRVMGYFTSLRSACALNNWMHGSSKSEDLFMSWTLGECFSGKGLAGAGGDVACSSAAAKQRAVLD